MRVKLSEKCKEEREEICDKIYTFINLIRPVGVLNVQRCKDKDIINNYNNFIQKVKE